MIDFKRGHTGVVLNWENNIATAIMVFSVPRLRSAHIVLPVITDNLQPERAMRFGKAIHWAGRVAKAERARLSAEVRS